MALTLEGEDWLAVGTAGVGEGLAAAGLVEEEEVGAREGAVEGAAVCRADNRSLGHRVQGGARHTSKQTRHTLAEVDSKAVEAVGGCTQSQTGRSQCNGGMGGSGAQAHVISGLSAPGRRRRGWVESADRDAGSQEAVGPIRVCEL